MYINAMGPAAMAPVSAASYVVTGSLLAAGIVFVIGALGLMAAAHRRRRHDLRITE
jgi:hypothetical protein